MQFNNGRTTTNNIFTSFDPQLTVEPQRHLHAAAAAQLQDRRHAPAAAGQPEEPGISQTQLQQSIAQTTRNVRNAFYDLQYAIGNLNVQRQSLELSQQSLKDNRARVEIGTMAPLDIVQAEAEVATREEAVIVAEAAIERQQDLLRALIFRPEAPEMWNTRIEPTETLHVRADGGRYRCGGEERAQPAHRSRRRRARTSSRTTSSIRYFNNQSLPDLNASVNYAAQAIGGVGLLRGPSSGLVSGTDHRPAWREATGRRSAQVFGGDFPGWTLLA